MGFLVKCPQCGIALDADEKYIGARVVCDECDFHFILQKNDKEKFTPEDGLNQDSSIYVENVEEYKPECDTIVDFKEFSFEYPPAKLTFAKPVTLIISGKTIEVNSWNDVLVICFDYALAHKNADVLRTFLDRESNFFSKRIILSTSAANLRRPRELSKKVFVETNFSASHIIQIVCGLIKFCGFPLEEFSIRYIPQKINVSVSNQLQNKSTSCKTNEVIKHEIVVSSPIEIFQFYPNVIQALKNQNILLVKDLMMIPESRFLCVDNFEDNKAKAMHILINALKHYFQKSTTGLIPLDLLPLAPTLSPLGKKNWLELSKNYKQVCGKQRSSFQAFDMGELKTIICRDFNSGLIFSAGTIKLLEYKLGRKCSKAEQRELKSAMFRRSDNVYLFPQMVSDEKTIADIIARIKEYFSTYECFSLSILYDEFEHSLHNLINPDSDFRLFLLKTILPHLPDSGKIFGRLQRQICISGNMSEEKIIKILSERIRKILQGYGDAMFIEELCSKLPYLNSSILEMILQEHIADAIEIRVDDLSYWKLIEFFCLPDDFSEYLELTIRAMEEMQAAPSLQTLSEAMDNKYGDGFREIYAIDDDAVFKQVIEVSMKNSEYSWNRNVFVKQNSGHKLNIADEFLQTQQGIFHESEFFDYASKHRGLKNTGMLILTFLRNKCIRLNQTHWISLKDFDNLSNFSVGMATLIAHELELLRGSNAFLSLGTLPEAFLSSLPVLNINKQVFYWNHYLLASIVTHRISKVQVINDDPSPYTVTAMIIPQHVKYQGDVVDLVFQDLRKNHYSFSSADDVFEYLRTHQIRVVKTKKLFARIRAFWGIE